MDYMLPELRLSSNRANSKHDSVPHYQISPFLVICFSICFYTEISIFMPVSFVRIDYLQITVI